MDYTFGVVFLCLNTITDVWCITCAQLGQEGRIQLTCEHGCCGSATNRTCCGNEGISENGRIAAIIFGVVFMICAIILVAFVLERKYFGKRGRSGNPVNPHTYGYPKGKEIEEAPTIGIYRLPAFSTRR